MEGFAKNTFRYLFRVNHKQNFLNARALKYFKRCHNILDVGCGSGVFVALDPKRISGIDSNPETVTLCRRNKLDVRKGIATKLPFKDNSFDGIHCAHVIEHLQPKDAYIFLKEASRVLKKNGILVIRTPLLWDGFYNNLTHIKPYNPDAIMRYLVHTSPDTTFPHIKTKFKKVALHWRYRSLFNILYRFGIHRMKKDGYMLVLRKIK